ncbi:MAG TPA: disulfide bond formation protein B [Steroidobacteraceae bacterium]|nr:disulfide bond formation protein B [Steroidobacteraceae bacterium]
MLAHRRLLNFAGALVCLGLLAFALYAQFVLHLEPCPLCVFQRLTVLALGIFFLLAALHNPGGPGRYVYGALILLAALATIGVAARHLYIQSQPPGTVPACGAPLDTLMQMFPVWEVVRKVLHGGGECAEVSWRFLGLAMPAWVLLWAAVLGAFGLLANVLPAPLHPAGPRFSRR